MSKAGGGLRRTDDERFTVAQQVVERLIRWISNATLIVVSLWVNVSGKDAFRLPKDLLFRGSAVILVAMTAIAWILGAPPRLPRLTRAVWIVLATAVGWAAVALAFSTNRPLGVLPLVYLGCSIVLFLAAVVALRDQSTWSTLAIVSLPAMVNAALTISQELDWWNPFFDRSKMITPRLATTGLIGNPGDLGAYLVPAALLLAVAALRLRGLARMGTAATAALLGCAVLLSQTLTAVAALGAAGALLVFKLIPTPRKRWMFAATALVLLAIALYRPVTVRLHFVGSLKAAGSLDRLLSGRLLAYATTVEIVRDHPLIGSGPGTFAWRYMPYTLLAQKRYPVLKSSVMRGVNFSEAHNEPLQFAAEAGIPAAVILALALWLLYRSGSRTVKSSQSGSLSPTLGPPLAVAAAVLCLGSFPLRLAAPTLMLIYVSAVCYAHAPAD